MRLPYSPERPAARGRHGAPARGPTTRRYAIGVVLGGGLAAAILLPACVPLVRSAGAAATPVDWFVFDSMRDAGQVLVLPVWNTVSGYHREGKPDLWIDHFGQPFLLPGRALYRLPVHVGTRGTAGLLFSSIAVGSRTDFEGAYLISDQGDLLILKSAEVERAGTRWRAALQARLSEVWRDELLAALDAELIRTSEQAPDSFWAARYQFANHETLHYFVLGLRPSLSADRQQMVRDFLRALPDDRLPADGSTWVQILRD